MVALAALSAVLGIVALGEGTLAAANPGGMTPNATASTANVSIAGTWSVVDTCTSTNCAGEKFYATAVIDQCPGSSTFTGSWPYGEVLSGTVSGNSVTMQDIGGGYDATVHMTISAAGDTWTGSYTDNGGGTGTTQATRTSTSSACVIDGCPVPTTPVDSVSTPTPPPLATTAQLLPLPPPTIIEPAYCPYRAKYTAAEKAAAAQWADYYNHESARLAKVAAGYGGVAAAATAIPDPTVSKALATLDGVIGAVFAYKAAEFNGLGVDQGIINRDPSDPNWRTIVTPLKTWPTRVPALPRLSSRARAAVHADFAAVLGNTANDWCVGTAINRASTALSQRNVSIAKAQYRAGARCAAASMRFEGTLPRLTRAASGPLTRLLRQSRSAALTHLVRAREHRAAFRRKVAAREIALIRQAIALPTSALAQMQATMANTVVAPASASAVRSLLSSTSSDAASALLEEQSAQVLAASG